jgi:salicylate 5-hydroxylase large subunit
MTTVDGRGTIQRRKWPPEGITRVPYWVYSDPELYSEEQAKLFGGPSWNYVALSCEIPSPGDFLRTTVGDKPVVVTRDDGGGVNVLVNRCAHRGVRFCQAGRGNAAEFMCPYHQWTYDLKGDLMAVPFRRGVKRQGGMPEGFSLEENGLDTLRVTERHGVVFATFSNHTPPLNNYLGTEMCHYFDRVFDGRPLRVLGYMRQRIPANWKLMFENIKDPYHASLLHVFLVTFGLFRADQKSEVIVSKDGAHSVLVSRKGEQKADQATAEMRSFRGDLSLRDERLLDIVREFPGDATVVMQTIWPNLIVQQQSNTLAMRQLVTDGPGTFELHWTFFGYVDDDEEMTTRRLRQANLMGPAGYVSIDDGEVMQFSQEGTVLHPDAAGVLEMGGDGTESQDHMVTEVAVRAFFKRYREVMDI